MDARDPRGLAGGWRRHQQHLAGAPPPDLAPWLDHLWAATWSYDEPFEQRIVPYPQVHLTIATDASARVQGVRTAFHVRVLEGEGGVVAAAFRPGVFRAVLGRSVSTLTDRSLWAEEVFPGIPIDGADLDDLTAYLRGALPSPDDAGQEAAAIVDRIARSPGTLRVDALAADAGLSIRTLQRLFAEHVGVGPKLVIRRYRLRDVTARMEAGEPVDWAGLAADLGYADHGHLTRDFTGLFGEPPTAYAARY